MCGRKQRQCGRGVSLTAPQQAYTVMPQAPFQQMHPNTQQTTGVVDLTGALNGLSMNHREVSNEKDFASARVPRSSLEKDFKPPMADEKEAFDQPPAYSRAIHQETARTPAVPTIYPSHTPQTVQVVSREDVVAQRLEVFKQALAAFKASQDQSKCARKRAAKNLVHDLYHAEVNRRVAANGRLQCGERKQIWKEMKTMKRAFRETAL